MTMMNFLETMAKLNKTVEKDQQSLNFLNDFITVDDTESDEAIVIKKGNCEIRLTNNKIEIAQDRLLSTKLTITQNDIEFKWRDGETLNLADINYMKTMFFRQQTLVPISAQSPLSYDPNTGNLAIALNFPTLTIQAPNTSTIPLIINTLTGGSNTLEVRRQDGTVGLFILNSGSLEIATGSTYRHSGTPVLGARRTGWSAMTGTATRASIATSTATTQQLAERLKALTDDLISHGLIGS